MKDVCATPGCGTWTRSKLCMDCKRKLKPAPMMQPCRFPRCEVMVKQRSNHLYCPDHTSMPYEAMKAKRT